MSDGSATSGRAPVAFLAALSLATLLYCAGTAWTALGGVPHVQDELSYLLQARIFAHGALWAPPSADGVLVASEYQQLTPRWFGVFPPGWPMVLALGARLGLPWLVNPLLAAGLPWLCWAAFSPVLRRTEAWFACAVAAFSPGILALGSSMMSHTLVLFDLLACVAAVRAGWFGVAGVAIGVTILARPLDGFVAGAPLIVWAATRARGSEHARLLVGPALGMALLLALNRAYTGSPFTFAVNRYFDAGSDWGMHWRPDCNRLGFGADRGCQASYKAEGYTPAMGLEFFGANAHFFDVLLLGFPLGGVVGLLGFGALVRRKAAEWPIVAAAVGPMAASSCYWYHGICYGARFWHPMYLLALPSLGVALGRWPRVGAVVLALGVGWTAPEVWRELADDYWGVSSHLGAELDAAGVTDGVVLVNPTGLPVRHWNLLKWERGECLPWLRPGAGLGENDPIVPGPILFLRYPSGLATTQSGGSPPRVPTLAQVEAMHPDVPIWQANVSLDAPTEVRRLR